MNSEERMNVEVLSPFEHPRMEIGREAREPMRAMVELEQVIDVDADLRQLVRLRASVLNGCAYCVDMHTTDARKAGESEQRLHAVAVWHESPLFDERERAALALTDAVTLVADGHVPREVYDHAARYFEPPALAQLIWAIAAINVWNRVAVATRMLPDGGQS